MKKTNNLGFSHGLLLPVIVVILAIGGVSYYVYKKNNPTKLNSETEQTTPETLPAPLPDSLLSVSKLKELVNTNKPGQSITGVELEQDNNTLVYKITLADGTVLLFNAQTGSLVSSSEGTQQDSNKLPSDFNVSVDFVKARSIAIGEKPGATVTSIELESEDGAVVYNVRFSDKSRIIINAQSGKIISIKHPDTSSKSDDSNTESESHDSKSGQSNSESESHKSTQSGTDDSGSGDSGSSDSGSGSGDSGQSSNDN